MGLHELLDPARVHGLAPTPVLLEIRADDEAVRQVEETR
jgi:hypothetical protein